jgi:sec-independent protein translocase protein TatC
LVKLLSDQSPADSPPPEFPVDSGPPAEFGEEDAGETKSFLEHLEDLRLMLVKMVVALLVAMGGSFFFVRELMALVIWPLQRVTGNAKPYLRTLEVTGGFMLAMQMAFWAGIVLSAPLLLYFVGQFVLPALRSKERRMLWPGFAGGAVLFLGGAALAYFAALPAGLKFFIEYNNYLGISSEWTIDNYISFVGMMMLAFGVSFELPLLILILAKLGLVSYRFLADKRPYAIITIFVIAAIITPTTDPINQTMLAGPMCILYEACIWITWLMERKDRRRQFDS